MDKKLYPGIFVMLLLILITASSGCTDQNEQSLARQSETVEITDMMGRSLSVPSDIDSIVAATGPHSILVYMLAPGKLAGWNTLSTSENMFMNESYTSLPILGSWGSAQTANYETVLSLNPDIVIEGYTMDKDGQISDDVDLRQEKLGNIPVVAVNGSIISIEEGDDSIEYLGELLGCKEQADAFFEFRLSVLNNIHSKVENIPYEEKVRVYYAESTNGLKTDPSCSLHSQVIDICGGVNVADCQLTPGTGMTPVSIEQVAEWNPEVILTTNSQFYNSVYSDPLWENIDAVQSKRVYLVPQNPFCWIDRPYGPHRVIGAAWTATVLYPELFEDMNMEQLTRDFYSRFLHYELTDEELDSLLYPEMETGT